MSKCYTAGFGESVTYTSKRKPKKKQPKPERKDKLEEYIAPNDSWVSTLYADPRTNHAEHIRFMNNFKPRPDDAAAWLYTEIR